MIFEANQISSHVISELFFGFCKCSKRKKEIDSICSLPNEIQDVPNEKVQVKVCIYHCNVYTPGFSSKWKMILMPSFTCHKTCFVCYEKFKWAFVKVALLSFCTWKCSHPANLQHLKLCSKSKEEHLHLESSSALLMSTLCCIVCAE